MAKSESVCKISFDTFEEGVADLMRACKKGDILSAKSNAENIYYAALSLELMIERYCRFDRQIIIYNHETENRRVICVLNDTLNRPMR